MILRRRWWVLFKRFSNSSSWAINSGNKGSLSLLLLLLLLLLPSLPVVVVVVVVVIVVLNLQNNYFRTSGQTSANQNSSRSHAVFQIILRKRWGRPFVYMHIGRENKCCIQKQESFVCSFVLSFFLLACLLTYIVLACPITFLPSYIFSILLVCLPCICFFFTCFFFLSSSVVIYLLTLFSAWQRSNRKRWCWRTFVRQIFSYWFSRLVYTLLSTDTC